MRRTTFIIALALIVASWPAASQPASQARPGTMLTIDSIMRGPKLVGSPPGAVRWST